MPELWPYARKKDAALADVLVYGSLIAPGIVLGKDGSLIAGWRVSGPDVLAASDADRDALSRRANTALLQLGGGWCLWYDTARLAAFEYPIASRSHFPDRVSRMVDDERREQFSGRLGLLESWHTLIVQFTPSSDQVRRLEQLVYDGAGQSPASRVLTDFQKALDGVENALHGALQVERLCEYEHTSEIVDHLDFCITGEVRSLRLPPDGGYLDGILGGRDFDTDHPMRLGDAFVGVVAIDGFPPASYSGILTRLDLLPFPYRWSTRWIALDQHEALGELHRYERKWKQRVRSFRDQVLKIDGRVNSDAVDMVADVQAAQAEAHGEQVRKGFYSSNVVVMAASEAELHEQTKLVAKAITSAGFAARVETTNAVDAWIGTLPGHHVANVRRPLMHTRNLVDMLALASLWQGPEAHECPMYPTGSPPLLYAATAGATPFRLSLHTGDIGHTMIFGPTGSGKTTLLATICMQALRYPRMRIWAFDYKRGLLAATKACDGLHHDIGGESGPSFAPLAELGTDDDCAFAEGWLALCYELQTGRKPAPSQTAAIHHAIELIRSSSLRTLSDFVAHVQDGEVKDALSFYTLAGTTGRLLDAECDGLADGHFVTLETEEFHGFPERIRIPVMLYLFRKFERALDGRPAMLVVDEAWSVLSNAQFSERLAIWLRTLRSKNCAVILAMQGLADVALSDIGPMIREACPTKIFLPNGAADQAGTAQNPGPRDFYEMLGCTPEDIALVREATPKREYYLVQPGGRRLFDLCLGPIALAFAGASSKDALARISCLERAHGGAWPEAWLKEKGVLA